MPSGMMGPVLKLWLCCCRVFSSPLQQSPFWIFFRISLVLFYSADRNCLWLVTSTGECEFTLHSTEAMGGWRYRRDLCNCLSAAGLEANGSPWAEFLWEIEPSEALAPSFHVKSVLFLDNGICCDIYT